MYKKKSIIIYNNFKKCIEKALILFKYNYFTLSILDKYAIIYIKRQKFEIKNNYKVVFQIFIYIFFGIFIFFRLVYL